MSKRYKHKAPQICSICGDELEGWGHNAQPINNGRCCGACNGDVIRERLKRDAAGLPIRAVWKMPQGAMRRWIIAGIVNTHEAHKQGYMSKDEILARKV